MTEKGRGGDQLGFGALIRGFRDLQPLPSNSSRWVSEDSSGKLAKIGLKNANWKKCQKILLFIRKNSHCVYIHTTIGLKISGNEDVWEHLILYE